MSTYVQVWVGLSHAAFKRMELDTDEKKIISHIVDIKKKARCYFLSVGYSTS